MCPERETTTTKEAFVSALGRTGPEHSFFIESSQWPTNTQHTLHTQTHTLKYTTSANMSHWLRDMKVWQWLYSSPCYYYMSGLEHLDHSTKTTHYPHHTRSLSTTPDFVSYFILNLLYSPVALSMHLVSYTPAVSPFIPLFCLEPPLS